MNGSELIIDSLLDNGVEVCFANPGTSEMHFVAALDKKPKMRCILGLHENIVTGAADGYFRVAKKPAATLLHLGVGLANASSNLHNAKRARSGVVNIVGDHSAALLQLDSPLSSDIETLAKFSSTHVKNIADATEIHESIATSVALALDGNISTLILPANVTWEEVPPDLAAFVSHPDKDEDEDFVARNAQALNKLSDNTNDRTLFLLGSDALRGEAKERLGRIASKIGCHIRAEFFSSYIDRGVGRTITPRLPYAVDPCVQELSKFDRIVLIGAKEPVAFFAYPDKPLKLAMNDTEIIHFVGPDENIDAATKQLEHFFDASTCQNTHLATRKVYQSDTNDLTSESIGEILCEIIPDNAIVVDESVSTGRGFDLLTHGAAPHSWLTGCGGAIGFSLGAAVGAAIAAPQRKVIALEGDGSGMYTLQSLWTMARERLNITVIIFANKAYNILRAELKHVGAADAGAAARRMLELTDPDINWVELSHGMGVPAVKVSTVSDLREALSNVSNDGPSLIEVSLA